MDNEIKATDENAQTPNPSAPENLALRGNPRGHPGGIGIRCTFTKVPVRKPDEIEAWLSSKLGERTQ